MPSDALVVVLSRRGLSIGRDGAVLAVPDADTAEWSKGFDSKYKRASRADLYLLPLAAALQAVEPGEASAPAAVIAADASISYRMLTETIYTLGQQRVKTVDIEARTRPGNTTAIPITLPSRFDASSPPSDEARRAILQWLGHDAAASASVLPAEPVPLDLNVIITASGFVVSASRRRMGSGCGEAGAGPAVPKHDDTYDFGALTACATTLKSSEPRFAQDTRVTVTADPDLDVQTLVTTLDALRGADARLFPEVVLGVPR